MNCPKCNTELKPGSKFCKACGAKVETVNVETNDKKTPIADDMNVAKQRIYWNIAPGQVARVIREDELEKYDSIKGIIVAEGTTAFIRANGQTIASISGGTYDFISNQSSFQEFVQQTGNSIRKGWQTILNLFKKRRMDAEEKSAQEIELERYANEQRLIFAKAKAGDAFSVVILLDRAFPLCIGAKRDSIQEYSQDFVPMTIETRNLDIEMGVNAFFQIKDKELFIRHYLSDKNEMNNAIIADELADIVRSTIQEVLYDKDLESNRIPDDLKSVIAEKLNQVGEEVFFGLKIVRIVEISADNEDLARFRELNKELYLSDRELDYIRRTNDFKNRLQSANIEQCASQVELERRMNEVNKDNLLSQDEFERFKIMLLNERIIFEAQKEDERIAALTEIRKTELIRNEDLDVIESQIKENKYKRGAALAFMQLKDSIEFERIRQQKEIESVIERKKAELQIDQLVIDQDFSNRVREDKHELDMERQYRDLDYEDTKRYSDLEAQRKKEQFEQFQAMAQMKEQMRQNERAHEATMQSQQLSHDENMANIHSGMSAEQILASNGGAAAEEFARSFSARNSVEAEREANRRVEEANMRNQEMLYSLMNRMVDNQAAQANLQAQQVMYQQNRADGAYNQSLNYTTRVPEQGNSPQQTSSSEKQNHAPAPAPSQSVQPEQKKVEVPKTKFCDMCGAKVDGSLKQCPECGEIID